VEWFVKARGVEPLRAARGRFFTGSPRLGFRLASKFARAVAFTAAFGSAWAPRNASAQAPAAPCSAWDVEYALSARLLLTDTPMGKGDGEYSIGPGTLVLRLGNVGDQPGGRVKLTSYEVRQAFDVVSKAVFFTTHVTTDATTRKSPDPCGAPAEGQLTGTTLVWSLPIAGFTTDGILTCQGFFCGKFGAPPDGRSTLHVGPSAVRFEPFRFSGDMKTFTMSSAFVSKTDAPRQTSHLSLAGREVRRACASVNRCSN
jgi:hypothetical protein